MKGRHVLTCAALAAVFGLCGCAGSEPAPDAPAPRPNILLCMTDDQGWADVGFNGLKRIQTPALDAMAAAGVRFNRFYAQQSCSPTRASVMTGRHPYRMPRRRPATPPRTSGSGT
jgi:arylsulfatase A-like enzyme